MRALIRYSDGFVQFIQVHSHQSYDGLEVELPGILEVQREDRRQVKVTLNRILGKEWQEVPEYVEEKAS